MGKVFDIAILGATPAGFAAAHHLSGRGLDVVVIDAPSQSAVECPLLDWVPRDLLKLDGLPDGLTKSAQVVPFKRVHYHNASLERTVNYLSRQPAGHFVHHLDLTRAMKSAAVAKGTKIRIAPAPVHIHLREDLVEIAGSLDLQARLLIVVQDRPSDIIGDLSLPMRTVPHSSLVVAALDLPVPGRPPREIESALHVVELPERSELGMFYQANSTLHIRVISSSSASGNRASELSTMVAGLQQAGLLPEALSLHRAKGAVWHPPAGVALELESHVAKRCMLVATAGGFAESITGHTLYPSIVTAMLAADLAADALDAANPQTVLTEFKNLWRKALADYLRPPNTSLQMLLPLLFANDRIVSKFTRALLYGDNI